MNVLILGAGAMGGLLGARLARTSSSVSILTRNREHVDAIRSAGQLVEELDGTLSKSDFPVLESPSEVKTPPDLVVVLVKSYDTDDAVRNVLPACLPSTLFLTLQNGIGNWENIAQIVGSERVLVGSTAQGSTLVAPGRVRHGGNGPTFIGEPHGPASERIGKVLALFRDAGLKAESSGHMEQLIWEKLMVNVGINAITALTGIRNGLVAEAEAARELCADAVGEAVRVANAKGFPVPSEITERVFRVARATSVNRSSMGQDVDRRRRTEIDAINGAIVRMGDELGIPVPVNRTLTRLIKIREAGYPG